MTTSIAPKGEGTRGSSTTASRRALVTGAERGIGRAVVLSLIKDGYDVVGVSRTQSELAQVAAGVEAPSTWHSQLDRKRDGLSDAGHTGDYAAWQRR